MLQYEETEMDSRKRLKSFKIEILTTEMQPTWNVKPKMKPVMIRATGTVSKSLTQYLSNIPGRHEIKELQKQPYWALHTNCGKC